MVRKLIIPQNPPSVYLSKEPLQQQDTISANALTMSKHSQRNTGRTRENFLPGAIFRPRPYEEIYTEQAYLTASIQHQSRRANELLAKYSFLEQELTRTEAGKHRRRVRKQLNQTRSQLNEAAEQEKAMFLRLSEVYMEGHSRDTWFEVGRQRAAYDERHGSWSSDATAAVSTRDAKRPITRLNGASPEFVPRKPRMPSRSTSRHSTPTQDPEEWSACSSTISGASLEDAEESIQPEDSDSREWSELSYQYKTDVGRNEDSGSPTRPSRSRRENRLSLPCLESIWPS